MNYSYKLLKCFITENKKLNNIGSITKTLIIQEKQTNYNNKFLKSNVIEQYKYSKLVNTIIISYKKQT